MTCPNSNSRSPPSLSHSMIPRCSTQKLLMIFNSLSLILHIQSISKARGEFCAHLTITPIRTISFSLPWPHHSPLTWTSEHADSPPTPSGFLSNPEINPMSLHCLSSDCPTAPSSCRLLLTSLSPPWLLCCLKCQPVLLLALLTCPLYPDPSALECSAPHPWNVLHWLAPSFPASTWNVTSSEECPWPPL